MKGLLFKQPLFEQVVSGGKTQTRRLVKIKDVRCIDIEARYSYVFEDEIYFKCKTKEGFCEKKSKPIYKKDEIVYLKEPYTEFSEGVYSYKFLNPDFVPGTKTKNKLFMPEKAARYFVKITDVRLERLQDITTEGIKAEGIHLSDPKANEEDYKNAWIQLWDKINKSLLRWNSNPFVWVYDFELHIKKEK